MSLFSYNENSNLTPLAERSRPKEFGEIRGQKHLLSTRSPLITLLKNQQLVSLIIWGPPGTGKTTLALNIAKMNDAYFIQMNAVDSGVKDLKQAGETGKEQRQQYQRKTILFVDEIHRFNKSQQDVLLPYLEKGDLYLIGATTETPSYELNKALLSRCQVIELKKLTEDDLKDILKDVATHEKFSLSDVLTDESLHKLLTYADGDARRLLNSFENILNLYKLGTDPDLFPIPAENLSEHLNQRMLAYDKKSEQHYDNISAFIKSMRGSDPDAAIYYCAKMLVGGEDPVFIARRMVIFASEDIGNADPRALSVAIACLQAVEAIGMPECRINLAQGVTYLASCPKSNASYDAINRAMSYVEKNNSGDIPGYLKSATRSGENTYKYPHNHEKGYVQQEYWPVGLKRENFYEPKNIGFEKNIIEYMNWLKK